MHATHDRRLNRFHAIAARDENAAKVLDEFLVRTHTHTHTQKQIIMIAQQKAKPYQHRAAHIIAVRVAFFSHFRQRINFVQ